MSTHQLLVEMKSKKFRDDSENLFKKIKKVISRSGLDKGFEIKGEYDYSGNVLTIMGWDDSAAYDDYEFIVKIEFVYSNPLALGKDRIKGLFGKSTDKISEDGKGLFLDSFKVSGEIQDTPFKSFSIKKDSPKETLAELLSIIVAITRKARTYGESTPDIENRSPESRENQRYGQHKIASKESTQDYLERALSSPDTEDAMKNFIIAYRKFHGKS